MTQPTSPRRYDLMPMAGIEAMAEAAAEGEVKYGADGWVHNQERGIPSSESLNHALGHIFAYLRGDRSEAHLGHALWRLAVAAHNERYAPHLVDISTRQVKKENP